MRLTLNAGLVELADLKKVVVSLLAESDSISRERLASGLLGSGMLTQWQAKKLLAGRGRGFFLGSYKLLRPLGKGGMGVVYLGEHRVMKRPMALKVLSSESALDSRRIERFESEARAAAQLDHINIVRAYDFAKDNGKLFIAMEYVDGIDLQHLVQRDGMISIAAALDAMKQTAAGLAHAHGRGIVHRDIKPANLLLRGDGVLKISDMGLARIGWQGESPNDAGRSRLLGTSEFLAPEQALDSRSVDGRADIYSLGCTLYYLLTGLPPYPGETQVQRIAKHQTAPVPDIRKKRPDCPAALAQLAIRMMAKRPEDRIPSATELLSQLAQINGGAGQGDGLGALRPVAMAGDTVSDASIYQATMSDSSIGSELDEVAVVEEGTFFDFSSLPPVTETTPLTTSTTFPSGAGKAVISRPAQVQAPILAVSRPGTMQPVDHGINRFQGNQQVMLGIGLAMAFLALLAVVGIGVVLALRPEEENRPIIKSTESRDGNPVVIIGR